ncbi:MAG TPA: hypothetical protein VL053_15490 [Arachidicoccus sp.]|nr:hypothetical protein [Arachidicoccus sp.]
MLRKTLIFVLVLGILVLGFYNFFIKGWYEFKKQTKTPKEFLNQTVIGKDSYSKDSAQLVKQLKVLLSNKVGFFNDSFYSDSTVLIVDTIVYSPKKDKLAFNIITQNPTAKQLVPDRDFKWYFDAATFIGIGDSSEFILQRIGSSYTNSRDLRSLSKEIRQNRFDRFITQNKKDDYEYNLNDVRFWNSLIWESLIV